MGGLENVSSFYVGRPEGIGNRLEELFKLNALCARGAVPYLDYYWNRARPGVPHFDPAPLISPISIKDCEDQLEHEPLSWWLKRLGIEGSISCQELQDSAKSFSVDRKAVGSDVVLVVRSTDRVSWKRTLKTPTDFMTPPQSKRIMARSIKLVRDFAPQSVSLVGESPPVLFEVRRRILQVVETEVMVLPPDPWLHLQEIASAPVAVVAAKFTSFPFAAWLMGGQGGRLFVPKEATSDLLTNRCISRFERF